MLEDILDSGGVWAWLGFGLAIIVTIYGLAVWTVGNEHEDKREHCIDLCAISGDAHYYDVYYGCFCVAPSGDRYNPTAIDED